jgi:AhpD family alkylhydroperoxidase
MRPSEVGRGPFAAASSVRSATAATLKSHDMTHAVYPDTTKELAADRTELAPETHEAFRAFSRQVFADGALPEKTKQLIAVAVAHVTQCPYCIRSHTRLALRKGATEPEIMEAIWVAAEMRAGGAYAHSVIALDAAGGDGVAVP